MTGRSTGVIARLYTPPDMASRASTSTARHEPIRALPAKSNVRCLIVVSSRTNSTPLFFSHFTRKVRTAGLTFKMVTNFIRRVGRGVHHRHPTFPPHMAGRAMGLIVREFFSPPIRRVEHRGLKRGDKKFKSCCLEQVRTDLCRARSVSSIRRVEHRGLRRGDKTQVLLPRTSANGAMPCSVWPPRASAIGRCSAC